MQPLPQLLNESARGVSPLRAAAMRLQALVADRLLRSGLLAVFDQAIVSGTGFATSVIIGRLCAPADLGTYYLALSVILFVRGMQEQLVSSPYTFHAQHRQGAELATYTGSVFVHQAMLTLVAVAAILVAAVAGSWAGAVLPADPATIAAVLGAVPLLLLREHLRQFAFARFRVATVIRLDLVVAIAQLGGLALLATTGTLEIATVYAAMGGGCLLACAGWYALGDRPFQFRISRFWPDWRHNWRFGRWMLASFLVGSSSPYVLPWFVAALRGAAETGVMAACNTLVGLANAVVLGLSNSLTPQAAQAYATGGTAELRRVLWKTAALFVSTLGSFCVVAYVAGDALAVTVYGENYAGIGGIVAAYALSLLAASLAITAGNGLCAMHRPSANVTADVAALVSTIAAAAALVPGLGVPGAAVASICGNTVSAGVRGAILIALLRRTPH
jgi:O-antigen/teichoic acid export membrane protein